MGRHWIRCSYAKQNPINGNDESKVATTMPNGAIPEFTSVSIWKGSSCNLESSDKSCCLPTDDDTRSASHHHSEELAPSRSVSNAGNES